MDLIEEQQKIIIDEYWDNKCYEKINYPLLDDILSHINYTNIINNVNDIFNDFVFLHTVLEEDPILEHSANSKAIIKPYNNHIIKKYNKNTEIAHLGLEGNLLFILV